MVLDYLDPYKEYIQHRLYRENCISTEEGVFIKDLRIFENRNLNDIILVDNAAYSFGFQIENGIPILPFYDSKEDIELKNLTSFLKNTSNLNIREINRKVFRLSEYHKFNDPVKLIKELYFN